MNKFIPVWLILLIVLVVSCDRPKDQNKKVLVIHARGLSYSDLSGYLHSGNPEGFFGRMAAAGALKKLAPVTNAVTITNIASFETGLEPSEHGIIGHVYGIRANDSLQFVSGFSQRFAHESFWEKVALGGKNVLNIGALTLHGKLDTLANVDMLAQGSLVSNGRFVHLIKDKQNEDLSIVNYIDLDGNSKIQLQPQNDQPVVFYTTSQENGTKTLVIDTDLNVGNGNITQLKKGEWTEIENATKSELKQAFRLKWLATSNDTLQIYVRSAFKNRGYPLAFLQELDSAVGPSRGWPNIPLFTSDKLSDQILLEEIHAELDYVMDVFSHASHRKSYDLLMIDYPLFDRLGHAFLRLRDSSEAVQKEYVNAFDRMNTDFGRIEAFAKKNGYDLVISSGHGFSPIHTSIDLSRFLQRQGIRLDRSKTDWQAIGVPGKVSAHIYLNSQMAVPERDTVLTILENAFSDLNEIAGKPAMVDLIYRKDNLNEIGLYHQNAGDLYVLLNPGFVFASSKTDDDTIFSTPAFMGDHGYSLSHTDSYGVFISELPCEGCHSTDVAKIILNKLLP